MTEKKFEGFDIGKGDKPVAWLMEDGKLVRPLTDEEIERAAAAAPAQSTPTHRGQTEAC